ncbi:hypothetical protein Aperf_G00000060952 [Anoplocephala perfoliata]
MLNRLCLLLLFVACLISSISGEILPSQGTETFEMNCFDPDCSTPYLSVELIVDLPELSLSKGTKAQVFAQSSDLYRVKVGDETYDIPLSFLRTIKHLQGDRALVRSKVPKVNSPIYFSTPVDLKLSEPQQPTFLSPDSDQKQAPASKQANIQSPPPPNAGDPHPSVEVHKKSEDASNRKPLNVKMSPYSSKETQNADDVIALSPSPHKIKTPPLSIQQKIPEHTTEPKTADIGTKLSPTSHILKSESPAVEVHARVEELKVTPSTDVKPLGTPPVEMSPKVNESKAPSAASDSVKTSEQAPVETTPKVVEIDVTPAPKFEPPSGNDSKQSEEDSVDEKIGEAEGLAVPPVKSAQQPQAIEISPETEISKESSVPVVRTVEQLPAVETSPNVKEGTVTSILSDVELSPKVNETKVNPSPETEPPTSSDSKQFKEDPVVETPKKGVEIEVASVPTVKSVEQSSVVESSPKVKKIKATPEVEIAPEKDSKQIKKHPPNVENVAPPPQTTQHAANDEIPQKRGAIKAISESTDAIDAKKIPTPLENKPSETKKGPPPVEQHQDTHPTSDPIELENEQPENQQLRPDAAVQTLFPPEFEEDAVSQPSPLSDIASASAFFHCLSFAANGSLVPSNFSSGGKSLFAGAVLFFAQHFFSAAKALLNRFPPSLVTPVDSIFTFTFKTPLVFFIAWALFILTALITWVVIKLLNKFLFYALSSSNPDDPSSRSLSQWLEMEENANLLADSLADKEEAYGRLIVWSTKISERYENQHRNHASSSTRIHGQLRETKAALADSLQENKELRDTHDALVEQLSNIKTEAAVNTAHLREEIATLNKRLEEGTRQHRESVAEKERVNEEIVSTLREEVKGYQAQVDNAEKTINVMKEANKKIEDDLAARDRELLSLREAFIELRSSELKDKKRASLATAKQKKSEDGASTDGWEVEDDVEAIIEEVEGVQQQGTSEDDEVEVQSELNVFLEVVRLRVALDEAEKLARAEASGHEQEAKLRVELEGKVDSLKSEAVELNQKLRSVTEECEFSKTKLEVLSEYFNEREAERQKDLGRKELSQSDMSAELNSLREKQRTSEVEVSTLREQLSSARRELAETERANRRHVSELDKRLHESRLMTRSLENQVKDLRAENAMLRQKMFVGDRGVLPPLLAGMPPPPPPPPPPAVALASSKHSETRPVSRQSEKGVTSHSQVLPPPPFLPFPQIPLAGSGGSQFIPPPPPPGLVPPGLFLSQMEANRQSPCTWDTSRSGPKAGSTNSGGNRSAKQSR